MISPEIRTRWPFTEQNIPARGLINPQPAMPAEQYGRSIDTFPRSQPTGGGGGGTGDWPLKLVKVDAENVKVLLGTVSGFSPANINTPIDVSGTDTTWRIYMHAGISGVSVTSATVFADDTGGFFFDDGNNSYRLIGEVDVAVSVITAVRPAMAWSQAVITCVADNLPHDWITGA